MFFQHISAKCQPIYPQRQILFQALTDFEFVRLIQEPMQSNRSCITLCSKTRSMIIHYILICVIFNAVCFYMYLFFFVLFFLFFLLWVFFVVIVCCIYVVWSILLNIDGVLIFSFIVFVLTCPELLANSGLFTFISMFVNI